MLSRLHLPIFEVQAHALLHVPRVQANTVLLDSGLDWRRPVAQETPVERREPAVLLHLRGTRLTPKTQPVVLV